MGITAADLLAKIQQEFNCPKTTFYERKKELIELNYQLEPDKSGRESYYSDEQVQVICDYLSWIRSGENPKEFPKSEHEAIVKQDSGELERQNAADYISLTPQENKDRRLDQIAQLEAARLDVLTNVYRVTGNYTIPGLKEQVETGKESLHKYQLAQSGNVSSLIPEYIGESLKQSETNCKAESSQASPRLEEETNLSEKDWKKEQQGAS